MDTQVIAETRPQQITEQAEKTMRRTLEGMGVLFHEKKNKITIPTQLDLMRLSALFTHLHAPAVLPQIEALIHFVKGEAISDWFENNHDARRKWVDEMERQHGKVFKAVYEDNNQFRGNRLSFVSGTIANLAKRLERVGHSKIADELSKTSSALIHLVRGNETIKPYTSLTEEEKLDVIGAHQKGIEKTLKRLGGEESVYETIPAT